MNYHLSLGFTWPNPFSSTGTLNTGCVNSSTGLVSNWNNLHGGDQITVYLYDQTCVINTTTCPNGSGATPAALASDWFDFTPQTADDDLFQSGEGFPADATLNFVGAMQSLAFGNNTYACWQVSPSSSSGDPCIATVDGVSSGQGEFSVVVTISMTKNGQTCTFTSQDPEMIVTPGN